jgi:hypothetical protein
MRGLLHIYLRPRRRRTVVLPPRGRPGISSAGLGIEYWLQLRDGYLGGCFLRGRGLLIRCVLFLSFKSSSSSE